MKTNLICLIAISTIAVAAFFTYTTSSTAQDPQLPRANNAFDGKLVTIYTNEKRERSGCILENAELRTIGGRLILIGTGADTGVADNWTVGVQIGVAWDNVTMYYAMTPAQFKAKKSKHAK